MLKSICFFIAIICFFWLEAQTVKPINKPNIVFILADDLGYGDLGCYGATDMYTPHIDALAQEGKQFKQFYSVASSCSPSRAALLTGKYPVQNGLVNTFKPNSWTGIDSTETTLAEMLQQVGYTTGIIGKWHLGHRQQYLPLQHGFDYYFGTPYSNDMSSLVYLRNNKVISHSVDQAGIIGKYTEEARNFIAAHQQEAFFLYLAYNAPHTPLYSNKAFEGKSKRGIYGDVVAELDASIGNIVQYIDSLGLGNNTLIIFTSDNGPWLKRLEHGGSAGQLRGGKGTTFEGGMRVPAVVRWQKHINPSIIDTPFITMLDWYPTLAYLVNHTEASYSTTGNNISHLLLDTPYEPLHRPYFAYYRGKSLAAYREDNWKIKFPFAGILPQFGGKYLGITAHDTLLFDLSKDPYEQHNLYLDKPAIAQQMHQKSLAFTTIISPSLVPVKITQSAADDRSSSYIKQTHASLSERYLILSYKRSIALGFVLFWGFIGIFWLGLKIGRSQK